jgi:ornithine carbamoyltransferase
MIWKATAQDLTKDLDLSNEEVVSLLELAEQVKGQPARYAHSLTGRYLSLLFEKPSLRTRLTFELAIKQLGGDCVVSIGPVADREPLKDVARNLDRWTNAIVARVFLQQTIDDLAKWSNVPVINALSDLYHPCQALADVLTLREQFGDLHGLKVTFVGDGNNVANSLMLSATRLGMNFTLACPAGFEPKAEVLSDARALAEVCGTSIEISHNPQEAVAGASAIYTDVWASMGQEQQVEERKRIFAPFQVNEALMSQARPNAVFMHCLPAKRGQEVNDAVMESPQSVVFNQAENRLHAQKALLLMMMS